MGDVLHIKLSQVVVPNVDVLMLRLFLRILNKYTFDAKSKSINR